MSITISSLTKKYGEQTAVDSLDFTIKEGEIVGFLGPNGAGKSTTMKMLTCFLTPTSGTAEVCGFDIQKESMEVRKSVGYLPEHNPLYKEMYIREFLRLSASIHVVKPANKRVEEIIEMTGLGPEQNKRIGQLSKGYRQRVGLAQAMLHDPKVLILDEPTSGLDPNQLIEIRKLIKEIGSNKTVLFSSHIMQEVQALCDRVLIINKGKLVADASIEELPSLIREDEVFCIGHLDESSKTILAKMPQCLKTENSVNGILLHFPKSSVDGKAIFSYCAEKKIYLNELRKMETSVEDVFQSLTQKSEA